MNSAIAVVTLLAFGLGTGSCAHVAPIAEGCSIDAVAAQAGNVDRALAAEDYGAELEALAIKFGACVIEAAVREVAGSLGTPVAMARVEAAPAETQKVARAKAWLATRAK